MISDKTPLERSRLLETTPLFASIHAESATAGQSAIPPNLDTDFHFISFVLAPDTSPETGPGHRLIELDGVRAGPVDHGPCDDLLTVSVFFQVAGGFTYIISGCCRFSQGEVYC